MKTKISKYLPTETLRKELTAASERIAGLREEIFPTPRVLYARRCENAIRTVIEAELLNREKRNEEPPRWLEGLSAI